MLYMVGYANPPKQLPLDELNGRPDWLLVDPEIRRRLLAMFDASDGKVGIGSGGRSSAVQLAVFLSRHREVPGPTAIVWDGRYWALVPGMAAAAPPGFSYHEQSTPDGFALAADLIGDLVWVHVHATEFDMHDFGGVNREPWHVQPVEIPNARKYYNADKARYPLHEWNPPIPPPVEEDDMTPIHLASATKGEWLWVPGHAPQPLKSPDERNAILAQLNITTGVQVSDAQLVGLFGEGPG